jgi:hypothetical protein
MHQGDLRLGARGTPRSPPLFDRSPAPMEELATTTKPGTAVLADLMLPNKPRLGAVTALGRRREEASPANFLHPIRTRAGAATTTASRPCGARESPPAPGYRHREPRSWPPGLDLGPDQPCVPPPDPSTREDCNRHRISRPFHQTSPPMRLATAASLRRNEVAMHLLRPPPYNSPGAASAIGATAAREVPTGGGLARIQFLQSRSRAGVAQDTTYIDHTLICMR